MTITLPTLTCTRCGHTWLQRVAAPKLCAKCKSPYWDRPKKKFRKVQKKVE